MDTEMLEVVADVQKLLAEIRAVEGVTASAVVDTRVAVGEARASVAEVRASIAEVRASLAIISEELVQQKSLFNVLMDAIADLRNDFEDSLNHTHQIEILEEEDTDSSEDDN